MLINHMLTYTEAEKIISSLAHSFGQEKVLLDDALGRVVAEAVYADRDYPPFNRAAMDGYAIRREDFLKGVKIYRIIETVFAGTASDKLLAAGECFKIMTGASVPLSADCIVRKEDAGEKNGVVSFSITEIKSFQNIAQKGEDIKQDIVVFNQPVNCTPSVIGVLASLGKHEVMVEKLPSIAIITTGNEVVPVGSMVTDVQIRNSNAHVLKALLKKRKLQPAYIRHVADDEKELESILSAALRYDLIIICGGVSAGDADYVPAVLSKLSVQKLFHKVAIRPGKPFWCGHKNKTVVFALPGNPLSCLVTFTVFIDSFLQACFRLPSEHISLPLQSERKQKAKLDEFFPVKIMGAPSALVPVAYNGSGDIRLGFEAQALALHPIDIPLLKTGEPVRAYLL